VPPTTGEVRLAGATLDQYGAEGLGHYIGYLPQEVQFFDGTVAENIAQMAESGPTTKRSWLPPRRRARMTSSCRCQRATTRRSRAAISLSGGQKQRLGLARALYNDPVILVLDEPNSALDAEGSEALNAAVNAMKDEGRAVIIMTHRPTAISTCDNLLVLDGGKGRRLRPARRDHQEAYEERRRRAARGAGRQGMSDAARNGAGGARGFRWSSALPPSP
jgi:ABC-type protease/lipase transport system fused ATPase/permease subunit